MRKKIVFTFLCAASIAAYSSVTAGQEYGEGRGEAAGMENVGKEQVQHADASYILYGGIARALAENSHNLENDLASYEQRQVQLTESSYHAKEETGGSQAGRPAKKSPDTAQSGTREADKKAESPAKKSPSSDEAKNGAQKAAGTAEDLAKMAGKSYRLPFYEGYTGMKTYEKYRTITSRSSLQWELQQAASTDKNGLRVVDGRYCVAIGSYFQTKIGQYFDLILANGTVIPCIMGDAKADRHTDRQYHIFTTKSQCCSEFIVDAGLLGGRVRASGDISELFSEWESPVAEVRVYQKNYFTPQSETD